MTDLFSTLFVLPVLQMEDVAPPIVGFIVVMAVLTAIWVLLEIQGRIFQRIDAASVEPEVEEEPEQGEFQGDIPPEMVAIITAAVHSSFNVPTRIVSIRQGSDTAWSSEGRRSIYSSHRIR